MWPADRSCPSQKRSGYQITLNASQSRTSCSRTMHHTATQMNKTSLSYTCVLFPMSRGIWKNKSKPSFSSFKRYNISTSLIVEGAFLIHKNGNDFVRFFFRSQVFRKAVFISSGSSQQTSLDLENLQRRAQCFCVSRGRWLSRVIKPSVYIFVRLLVSAVKKKSEINCLKINRVYSMWHLGAFRIKLRSLTINMTLWCCTDTDVIWY